MKQRRGTKCLLFRALFGKNRHFNRRGQWPRCVLPPIPRGGVFPFTGRSPGLASSAGAPSQRFFRQWLHRFSSAHVPLSASRLLGQRRSCTGFPCSPNTPVSDAAHRCAPVWAVHLSRILYMLTAHLSICYASLTLSRRFAIILMEETALVDFIRFLCISFRTQGASSLSKPKSSMDNHVSPVTIKIKQHGSERAEGVKGAIADFVRFHCPLVASAEAKHLRQNAQYPKMQPSTPKAISAPVRRALPNLFPHRK